MQLFQQLGEAGCQRTSGVSKRHVSDHLAPTVRIVYEISGAVVQVVYMTPIPASYCGLPLPPRRRRHLKGKGQAGPFPSGPGATLEWPVCVERSHQGRAQDPWGHDGPWGHRCKPCKPAPFGGFGRNLAEFSEEPKSAIEGLEGLALEYTWQELHQARGCKQREQKTLRELRERRRLTAFQRLASWVQVPVVRPSNLCLESHRSYKVDESEVAVVCIRYSLPCYTVRGHRSGCEGWKLRA